jgi:hypothetical protein
MGWRYLFYTCGALVFALSMCRVLVIRFHETPKFLLCQGRDEDVVKTLERLAHNYDRPYSLTLAQIQSYGQIHNAHAQKRLLSAKWPYMCEACSQIALWLYRPL